MNRQKVKYFIFRYILGLLPDELFAFLIRYLNAYRFKIQFYWLTNNSFFGIINSIKHKKPNPDMVLLADKSEMRNRLFDLYGLTDFVKIVGVYKTLDDIKSADLKFPCFIKLNRGSGMNLIAHSREELFSVQTMDTLRFWFSLDPYYYSRETHYSEMKPCFVVEEYMGDCLNDYKIFCFNGQPKFIQVDIDRFNGHKRSFYDINWNLMEIGMLYPRPTKLINPPAFLAKMIEISSLISNPFEFIRIDFYVTDNTCLIGECTFFPEGGNGLFDNRDQDNQLGSLFSKIN